MDSDAAIDSETMDSQPRNPAGACCPLAAVASPPAAAPAAAPAVAPAGNAPPGVAEAGERDGRRQLVGGRRGVLEVLPQYPAFPKLTSRLGPTRINLQ